MNNRALGLGGTEGDRQREREREWGCLEKVSVSGQGERGDPDHEIGGGGEAGIVD
ncbi:hypothetical protein CCACVL1_13949 [Corchorus capsularis]|uniref:Uncharacterized protein n=1 Tax=Corchorus capsularis TaxID=210143 RepID=A0A1R3I8T1_COCAP|nr:hypothetical protein CCACVL1_13949 [Corchorus capsularis]